MGVGPELGLEMRSVTTAVLICSRGSLSHPPPHAVEAGRMVYSHGCVRDKQPPRWHLLLNLGVQGPPPHVVVLARCAAS